MKGTKERNTNKGITLIALVITIIVMLILVAVTISMAVNGGLFNYAGKAVGETQNALDVEQQLANGKIQVDGKWYASIDDYLAGKELLFSYEETKKDENGLLIANATYTSGEYTAVIPKGFAIVPGLNGTTTIEDGLVITDELDAEGNSIGNEFVWIPVEKAIVTQAEIATIKEGDTSITTDLAAVQKMVNAGTYPMAVQIGEGYKGILYDFSELIVGKTVKVINWASTSSCNEPVNLDKNYDNTTNLDTWTENLYQIAFNSMVESVAVNGGFYVGRYEISTGIYTLEDESTITYAQSKRGETALVSTTWYDMYKYERDYAKYNTNLGVTSEMIWGSQWDQMMIFVNGKEDGAEPPVTFEVRSSGARESESLETLTGMNIVNQVANIFDLEGMKYEWTQEKRLYYRVHRGGNEGKTYGASARAWYFTSDFKSSYISSRTSLYIK